MDDIRLKYYTPIVTGNPGAIRTTVGRTDKSDSQSGEASFQDVLAETLKSSEVNFSKHAVKRVTEREIEFTAENLARLNEGIRIASEKNLGDALIMVDGTAFVVNAKSNTIITAVNESSAKGRVFTNIEGTVIV